jgi:ankyrin repeat protein
MKTIEEIKLNLLNEDIDAFKKSLNDYDVNQTDNYGNNILHYCILNIDNIKIPFKILFTELVNKGLDINAKQTKKDQRTALHLAVLIKSKEIFDQLIDANVNIDPQDVNGNTPLWLSIMNYRKDDDGYFPKILLYKGANPKLKNIYGVSPKKLANTISNYDIKKILDNIK